MPLEHEPSRDAQRRAQLRNLLLQRRAQLAGTLQERLFRSTLSCVDEHAGSLSGSVQELISAAADVLADAGVSTDHLVVIDGGDPVRQLIQSLACMSLGADAALLSAQWPDHYARMQERALSRHCREDLVPAADHVRIARRAEGRAGAGLWLKHGQSWWLVQWTRALHQAQDALRWAVRDPQDALCVPADLTAMGAWALAVSALLQSVKVRFDAHTPTPTRLSGRDWHPLVGFLSFEDALWRSQVTIVDARGRPLPRGAVGEIALPMQGDARDSGDDAQMPAGLLRLKQCARLREDGSIHLLADRSRLFWRDSIAVDCDEVEAQIAQLPGVKSCFTQIRCRADEHPFLAAFMFAPQTNASALEQLLSSRLPVQLRPRHIVELRRNPRTVLGDPDVAVINASALISEQQCELWSADSRTAGLQLTLRPRSAEAIYRRLPGLSELAPQKALSNRPALLPGRPREGFTGTASLASVLLDAATRGAGGLVFVGERGASEIAYAELLTEARKLASGMRSAGIAPGACVVIALEDNLDILSVFWGCQLGGFVPLVCDAPSQAARKDAVVERIASVLPLLGPGTAVVGAPHDRPLFATLPAGEGARYLTCEELRAEPHAELAVDSQAEVALLLMTSGSTGRPKLVEQTHHALLSWADEARGSLPDEPALVTLNWLPLSHVGGLVYFHLRDVFAGARQIHAHTAHVLRNPLTWLDLIDQYRVNVTWAPNFAYALVTECFNKDPQHRWDLSCLRVAFNAGEAVVPATAARFLETFERFGLDAGALCPAWGMSETCSAVVYNHSYIRSAEALGRNALPSGRPLPSVGVRIVDDEDAVVRERVVGHLQVRGPTITRGYRCDPAATSAAFTRDGWFRTGDLGVIVNGQLTITGRSGATIIIDGVNFHSQEIESVLERLPFVATSYAAAFAVREEGAATDSLIIVLALEPAAGVDPSEVRTQVAQHLFASFAITFQHLILLPKDEVPKTNIGKIQHKKLAAMFSADAFSPSAVRLTTAEKSLADPHRFAISSWRPAKPVAANVDDPLFVALRSASQAALDWAIDCAPGWESLPPAELDSAVSAVLDAVQPSRASALVALLFWPRPCTDVALTHFMCARLARLLAGQSGTRRVDLIVFKEGEDPDGLRGLLHSANREFPGLSCRLVQHESGLTAQQREHIVRVEACARESATHVRYFGTDRHCAALTSVEMKAPQDLPFQFGGTYLVSGGLSEVVRPLLELLLADFDARLILLGRRSRELAEPILRSLASCGGQLSYASCDVADEARLTALLAAPDFSAAPLDGVIHAAGIHRSQLIDEHTAESWAAQLTAKVTGTEVLIRCLERMSGAPAPLFVQLSSVNAVVGAFGGSAYATAADYQIRVSEQLNSEKSAVSYCISLSTVEEKGMSKRRTDKAAAGAAGAVVLDPLRAFRSLLWCLHQPPGEYAVGLDIGHEALNDLSFSGSPLKFEPASGARQEPGVCADETGRECRFVPARRTAASTIPPTFRDKSQQRVHAVWCATLDRPAIALDENFFAAGGNSMKLIQLKQGVDSEFGIDVKISVLFQHPTIEKLAAALAERGAAPDRKEETMRDRAAHRNRMLAAKRESAGRRP